MSVNMDCFNALPVFVAVIEQGGFSAAAKWLGISTPAVSKRIGLLEQQLGVRLLYRTTRKLSLTEAGERYYVYAKESVIAAQKARQAVEQLQGEPQGVLKIATPMSFGQLHMSPLLAEFLSKYPLIQLDVVMDDRHVDLVSQGIDVAIQMGDLSDSTVVARALAPAHSVICASPAYLDTHPMPNTPESLIDHNCIGFSYSAQSGHWIFKRENTQTEQRVRGRYQVNNSEALRQALLKGVGIGRLPSFVAYQDLIAGSLVQLLPQYSLPHKMIYAIYPQRQYLPAKVRAFIDFVVEYFGVDTPYWDKY